VKYQKSIKNTLALAKRNHILKFIAYKIFKPKLSFTNVDISNFYEHYRTEKPFLKYRTNIFEDFINTSFNLEPGAPEVEYLVNYPYSCTIEPFIGWALDKKNKLIQISLPYGDSNIWSIPNQIYYKTKKFIDIDCAVSIRYNWFNYWHFYNDIIGQLYLLEKLNFDKSIPLIIPKKALNLEYVQSFLNTDYAKRWKWIFQDSETYIRLKGAYFCKCIPNVKEQFIFANKILNLPKDKRVVPKRIYIKRDKKRGRYITNFEEIEQLLKWYNFEIVDAEIMSLNDQVKLFSYASLVVGPHGAGLTNIFYRYSANCTLLEIFPLNHAPAHYYWLARELGYKYDAISGSELINGEFILDKKQLENALIKLLVDNTFEPL
jgi:hypothetical protein